MTAGANFEARFSCVSSRRLCGVEKRTQAKKGGQVADSSRASVKFLSKRRQIGAVFQNSCFSCRVVLVEFGSR